MPKSPDAPPKPRRPAPATLLDAKFDLRVKPTLTGQTRRKRASRWLGTQLHRRPGTGPKVEK